MSFSNDAEGGVNGAVPTTSDTGSGDAFTTVSKGANSIFDYSSAHPAHGSLGYRIGNHTATAESNFVEWTNPTSVTTFYHRFYLLSDVTNTFATWLLQSRSGSSSLNGALVLGTAQKLFVQNRNGTIFWRSTNALSTNTQYRIEVFGNWTGSVWNWEVLIAQGDNVTLLEDSGVFATDAGEASTSDRVRFGSGLVAATWPSATGYIFLDDPAAFGSTWWGPVTQTKIKTQSATARLTRTVTATQTATANILNSPAVYATAGYEQGTVGSNILAADPGDATPWNAVTVNSPNTLTYDSTPLTVGGQSAKYVSAGGTSMFSAWTTTAFGNRTDYNQRGYFKMTTNPPVKVILLWNLNGSTTVMRTQINTTGKIEIADSSTVYATSTTTVTGATPFRIETHLDHINGNMTAQLFVGANVEGTSPDETISTTGQTFAALTSTVLRVGSGNGGSWTLWADAIALGYGGAIGPAGTGTVSKTQTATARIRKNLTLTQTATANIIFTNTRTVTQPAHARVQKIFTKTQTATANITATGTNYGMSNTCTTTGTEGDTASNWKLTRDAYLPVNVAYRREYNTGLPASYNGGDAPLSIRPFLSFNTAYANIMNGVDKTAIQAYVNTWPTNTYATWQPDPEDPAKEFVADPVNNFVLPFQTLYGWVKQVRPDVSFGPVYGAVQWYNNGTADPTFGRATRWIVNSAFCDFYGVDWYNLETNPNNWNLSTATDFQNWYATFQSRGKALWITEFGIKASTSLSGGKDDAASTAIINASHGWANTHTIAGVMYYNVINASGGNDYQLTPSVSDAIGRPNALQAWINWVQLVTQTTQTAKAAIRKTGVTKTQSATAHIENSYFGVGMFGASTFAPPNVSHPSASIGATARIRVTGLINTQTAVAEITAGRATKTQTAIARVAIIGTKTQVAVARVLVLGRTKTQSAIARVVLGFTKTQTSTARVSVAGLTKTQTATGRISNTNVSATQTAVGRVSKSFTKTQTSIAKIQILPTKTQLAHARVQKTLSKSQTAQANIIGFGVNTVSQTSVARMLVPGLTVTQVSSARISKSFTKTQGAVARISTSRVLTQMSIARVVNSATKTQLALARVQKSLTKAQTSLARIRVTATKTQTSIARIRAGRTTTQTAIASVRGSSTRTQLAVARVKVNGVRFTQSALAYIQIRRAVTQTATASVQNAASVSQQARAMIIPYRVLPLGRVKIRVG